MARRVGREIPATETVAVEAAEQSTAHEAKSETGAVAWSTMPAVSTGAAHSAEFRLECRSGVADIAAAQLTVACGYVCVR